MLIDALSAVSAGVPAAAPMLAMGFLNMVWGLLAFFLVVLCLGMILIILIQDPKGGGLSNAFGAGGETVFGAQAQRGITRVTGVMTAIFLVLVLIMVLLDNKVLSRQSAGSAGAGDVPVEIEAPPTEGTSGDGATGMDILPPSGGIGTDGETGAGAAGSTGADTPTVPAPSATPTPTPTPGTPGDGAADAESGEGAGGDEESASGS